jgi:hypothetical protein
VEPVVLAAQTAHEVALDQAQGRPSAGLWRELFQTWLAAQLAGKPGKRLSFPAAIV